MPIITRSIALSPFTLFRLALSRHYKNKQWMLWAVLIGFMSYAILLSYASNQIQKYLGIFGYGIILTFFLLIPTFYWRQVHLMKNKGFFLPRYYEIDQEQIQAHVDDGSKGKYAWEKVIHVSESSKHYLLFLSASQFLYITKKAFKSLEDHQRFIELIQPKLAA